MDSTKYYFSSEGCSSSESGWTKYMDSPMEEDEAECNDVYAEDDDSSYRIRNENDVNHVGGDDKQESDDSMASDASSRPSHQYKRANYDKGNRSVATSSKQSKLENVKKIFSWKKTNEKKKEKKFSK